MKDAEVKNPDDIKLTKSDTDGIWLHFESNGKSCGGIRIDDPLFPKRTIWAAQQFSKVETKNDKARENTDIIVTMNHPPEGYDLEFIEEIQAGLDKILIGFGFARSGPTEVGEKTQWHYYQSFEVE